MLHVGVALVALGLLDILFQPKWVPRWIRRVLPHAGYLVLGFAAVEDRVAIGHIAGQAAITPDSSLRTIAPVLLKAHPRTLATLLPPDFVGTPHTLNLALQVAIVVTVAAMLVAFTRPEWLRPVSHSVVRVGGALGVLLVAWTTGIHSRTLNTIRDTMQIDGDAPLRSIADLIEAIRGEYLRSGYTIVLILGTILSVHLFRVSALKLQRRRRRARGWYAA